MQWLSTNWLHVLGVALAVLNAILAAVAADPSTYGLSSQYVGAWLALVVLAIGMILKELPSATQQQTIQQQQSDIVNLNGKVHHVAKPKPVKKEPTA